MSPLGSGVALFSNFNCSLFPFSFYFSMLFLDTQWIFYVYLNLGSSWTLHVLNHVYARKKGHKILLLISALTIQVQKPTRFSLTVHYRKESALASILPSHCTHPCGRSL